MAQKIIRIGSSLGVTIPKTMLQKINANMGDQIALSFSESKNSIEIKKVGSQLDEQTVEQALKLLNKYQDELNKVDSK